MPASLAQQVSADNAANTQTTITGTITIGGTGSNSILVQVATNPNYSLSSVLLDGTTALVQRGTAAVDGGSIRQATQWTIDNVATGAHTITANFPAPINAPGNMMLNEIQGTSGFLVAANGHAQLNPGTGTDAVTSNAAVNSQPALLIGYTMNINGGTIPSAGTGFTPAASATPPSLGNVLRTETGHGALTTATFTAPSGTDTYMTLLALFGDAVTPLASAAATTTSANAALTTAIRAAAAASASTSAAAALTNWTTVTLTAPLYTGPGGILDPQATNWPDIPPSVGSVIFYDATHVSIATNGIISSNANPCTAVCGFYIGADWSPGLIIITPQIATYALAVAAAAGMMTTGIAMAGAALSATSSAGNLSTGVQLATLALIVTNAAASMITAIQLQGAGTSDTAAHGALQGGVASLQGNVSVLSSSVAALKAQIQFAAQAVSGSVVTGALTAQTTFQSAAVALVQAAAQLDTFVQFAGNAQVITSAAGAALTISSISGVANVVTSAVSALLTAIQLGGQALAGVNVVGDLTTQISFSGSAIVDSVAQLIPPGLDGVYGRADIIVFSPTGLPAVLATFIAGTSSLIEIDYFNALNEPFTPDGVRYRVDDVITSANLLPFTPIAPGMTNTVTLPGSVNVMINNTRSSEEHQILFEITDSFGNVNYTLATFALIRVAGVN